MSAVRRKKFNVINKLLFNGERMKNELENFGISDKERTKCEIWTRAMGYHRPTDSFNVGKKGEVAERKYFDQKKCESKILSS